MKKSSLLCLSILLCLLSAWLLRAHYSKPSGTGTTEVGVAHQERVKTGAPDAVVSAAANEDNPAAPDTQPLSAAAATIHAALEAALVELQSGDPARREAALQMLDELLSGAGHDAKAAIDAIMAFLRSGRDAQTGEEFVVGAEGLLDHAPTLRSLLMDHLGSLCLEAGQTEALTLAHSVLGKFGSTDEWAVCLRNTAWLDAKSGDFLTQKMEQMLSHEAWLKNPTRSFLESFDVIGSVGATSLLPRLEQFTSNQEMANLWRAGTVALDQFATNHPLETLQYLQSHPEFLQDRPLQRADLLAKADMGKSDQRALVEAYLQNPKFTADERGKVIDGLALQGGFLSQNLLTRPQAITPESEQLRIAMLHDLGNQWKGSNRFPDLNEYIDNLLLTTQPPPAE